jgi:ABC-type xylose transport system permease subunit
MSRLTKPTPQWFKRIRNIGITLGAIGGAIIAAPVALPATIVTIAGYLITVGGVAAAVAQTAKEGE